MFFKEGKNCWKIVQAERAAFLVDGENYFGAVADACESAEKSIFIVGWDTDSRVRLRRGPQHEDEPLGQFLDRLAEQNPSLQIYILEWDFSMLYSLERETLPLLSFGWRTNERVYFKLDNKHPVGASHHQKVIVVDDQVAFVGGFDLAICRWDTTDHYAEHPDRIDNGTPYGPFHDVQMLVSGESAVALGDLCRQRWQRATGEELSPSACRADRDSDPWPQRVEPDLLDTPVAILRTVAAHDDAPEIREIEHFYLNAIDQAKTLLYIENQYLTSDIIGKHLQHCLEREDGPEILLVLPQRCSGWLEQETMGALRQRMLKQLYAADKFSRLMIFYPDRQDSNCTTINVHSKVMTVDDSLVTVGSANLNNRSMGFDSECNLAISADGKHEIEAAIAAFRNRLLAEHLGVEARDLERMSAQEGSWRKTVVAANRHSRSRCLRDLRPQDNTSVTDVLPVDEFVDPERPLSLGKLLAYFDIGTDDGHQRQARKKAGYFILALLLASMLALLWRWSPLNDWFNLDTLLAAVDSVRDSPLAYPVILFLFVAGSCLMFPITILILATALSFGPVTGFFLAFVGSILGGGASYLAGRWLGRDVVSKLAGKKLNRLSRKLAQHGWLAIAIVRIVPIAPFTIINLVAGSTHITFRSFVFGTAIGMGPGIMAIMLFEGGLEQIIRQPGWDSLLIALIAIGIAATLMYAANRWLARQGQSDGN